jgi:hypothetical protein
MKKKGEENFGLQFIYFETNRKLNKCSLGFQNPKLDEAQLAQLRTKRVNMHLELALSNSLSFLHFPVGANAIGSTDPGYIGIFFNPIPSGEAIE